MKINYSYHLCPICGLPSNSTSRVCPKHISIIYDSNGKVITYQDVLIRTTDIRCMRDK